MGRVHRVVLHVVMVMVRVKCCLILASVAAVAVLSLLLILRHFLVQITMLIHGVVAVLSAIWWAVRIPVRVMSCVMIIRHRLLLHVKWLMVRFRGLCVGNLSLFLCLFVLLILFVVWLANLQLPRL